MLAAAGPVFARRGFDRATVREICGLAGVNVAAVAYYFGDKLGLYREVFRQIRQRCQDDVLDTSVIVGDPRQALYLQVRHLLSRVLARDDSGWESQLMMREMNQPTAVFDEMVKESIRPQFERLIETLSLLSPPATPLPVLQRLVLSLVGQCLYYRIGAGVVKRLIPADRMASDFDIDSLAKHITAVTLAAAENGLVLEHHASLGRLADDLTQAHSSDLKP